MMPGSSRILSLAMIEWVNLAVVPLGQAAR